MRSEGRKRQEGKALGQRMDSAPLTTADCTPTTGFP